MDFSKLEESQEKKVREAHSTLSENKVKDLVRYTRGNVICNEEQAMFVTLAWLSGWMEQRQNYINVVTIGSSGGGKSHLVGKQKQLIPEVARYEATSSSDKGFVDDDDWEGTRVATLDEINKLSDDIIEYIKTVSADEEYNYKRSVQDPDSRTGFTTEEITKEPKPVSFQYAQYEMDNELYNRLFKNYVDESEAIHRAIGRKEAGHQEIEVEGTNDDIEYIFETDELENALRTHVESLPLNAHVELPEWVWYACEPIFNHSRTEVNRIYGMIFNFIRASALLNYDNRRGEGTEEDPIIAEEQDVVNILSGRRTLTGTTHELEPRKWAIIEAIRENSAYDGGGGCTREDIHEYLDSSGNDAIDIKQNQLKPLIEELENNYIIKAHRDRKPYEYEFRTLAKLGTPRCTFEDWDVDLREVTDPIRNQPFEKTLRQWEDFRRDKGRLDSEDTDASQSPSDASQGQSSLDTGDTTDYDLNAFETDVHGVLREHIDGEIVKWEDFEVENAVGVVEPDEEVPVNPDVSGTVFDPEHEIFDRAEKDEEWVVNETEAMTVVTDAFKSLLKKGILYKEQAGDTDSFYEIKIRDIE
mgnify:CR=1 FL=1